MNDWDTLTRLLVYVQAAFKEYDRVGLPALEVYHAAKVTVRFALNHTDICLPMRRKSVA